MKELVKNQNRRRFLRGGGALAGAALASTASAAGALAGQAQPLEVAPWSKTPGEPAL